MLAAQSSSFIIGVQIVLSEVNQLKKEDKPYHNTLELLN